MIRSCLTCLNAQATLVINFTKTHTHAIIDSQIIIIIWLALITCNPYAVSSVSAHEEVFHDEATSSPKLLCPDFKVLAYPCPSPTSIPKTVTKQSLENGSNRMQSTPVAPETIEDYVRQYGSEYNVDSNLLKRIAHCESGFNAQAISPNGLYAGLFQFVDTTWISNRKAMGLDPNPDLRFNAEEAVKTAAFKIARDGTGAWPVCGKR